MNRGGRPATGDKRRALTGRSNIGFQSPGPLKLKLLAAAKANARSLSAEIVSRLERSFDRDCIRRLLDEREAAE
jgi:hypothetical protein